LDTGADPTWNGAALALLSLGRHDWERRQVLDPLRVHQDGRLAPVAEWLEALDDGDADRALELAGPPDARVELTTPLALLYARTLVAAGRRDEAVTLLRARLSAAPEFCEGRAVLGGLLVESGKTGEGASMLADILSGAEAPQASPAMFGCAATAAAALGEPARAGRWLRRIAEQDNALQCRLRETVRLTGDLPVRLRLFPWGAVVEHPAVRAATDDLERAYTRLRDETRLLYGGPMVGNDS